MEYRNSINRKLVIFLILTLALAILPIRGTEAVESNHVHTKVDPDETIKPFDPDDSVGFEIIFYADTTNDVHVNYSAVDSGGEFNLTNWEILFDKTDFTISYNEEITVMITVTTNLTVADKGRYLDLTVWGDVADIDRDDIDTNASTFQAIISEEDDVKLSVDGENSVKLVYPRKETRFDFTVTNAGWATNSISLAARIVGSSGQNWTVKVISNYLYQMQPLETRTGTVNISSPEIISPGDYTLQVTATVGAVGRDTLDLVARVAEPDLSVEEIVLSHDPIVLDGARVQIKVAIKNEGGYVKNVNVRGDVKGHGDKWERLPDATVTSITNYDESYAILYWTAQKNDKKSYSEVWTIRITVDELNYIEETDEGNNEGTTTIEVRGIEKTSVSFNPAPALVILGMMLVFTGAVALDPRGKKD